ncbi:hypothetical protein Tco_1297330, partial [Tanacetum coccineum]
DNVTDEAVHEEREDSLVRAVTTATGLYVEQDSGNINKTQSKATPNEPSSSGAGSGGGPRCQDTILRDTNAQTRFETVSKQSNDPPLLRVNTLKSGEDRLKLTELMELCTQLSQKVLDLEKAKTAQDSEIAKLKKMVKQPERKNKSKTPGLKRLRKVRSTRMVISSKDEGLGDQEDAFKHERKIADIDRDVEVTLIDETQGKYVDDLMFDTGVLAVTIAGEVVTTANVEVSAISATPISAASTIQVSVATTTTTTGTHVPTLPTTPTTAVARIRPKDKGIVIQEFEETTTRTTTTTVHSQKSKDKGKAKMIEPEKPLKKKEPISLDEELARKLEAEELETARLEREEAERLKQSNIALIES